MLKPRIRKLMAYSRKAWLVSASSAASYPTKNRATWGMIAMDAPVRVTATTPMSRRLLLYRLWTSFRFRAP